MDTSKLKKFASFARTSLIEQVGTRLKTVLAEQSLARRESAAAVAELEKKIKELGEERVIEMVAYTWFNRFCALRFMDVNQYTTIGTVSPAEGFTQPEILTEAKQGVIDEELKVDRAKIIGLLDGTRPSQDAQGEVYQQLLIAVCNSYHKLMPFMFEKIADYTELLIPEDLLSDSSVLAETRKALTAENCADVEVIGWLYQFYISEKKDDVFAALKKGKKITPENIPAATQLFTPHWIVRYLVENSLGRLWMFNHPDSRLIEQMDYYIRPEEPETDFLRIASPEEIKVCDPACGSGHMLTYAFDLLYAIYEEQGYQGTDIPRLILKHNLHGVEIDQRAGALAAFALVMKARQKDRRYFSRKPLDEDSSTAIQNPNVCVLENISIDPEDLSAYMDKVGRDLFSGGLQGVVNQWEEADNFGSLIRPLVTDVSDVLELLRERQMGQDLFLAGVHQKVLKALRQADLMSPKYHVVVANPPYMGVKSLNPRMKEFGERYFPDSKSDSFAMFMERGFDLIQAGAYSAMVTMQSWMFLSSYERLRRRLLCEAQLNSMVHMGNNVMGIAFGTAATVWRNSAANKNASHFSYVSLEDLDSSGHPKEFPVINDRLRCVPQAYFSAFPGSPIAYWVSDSIREAFVRATSLAELAEIRQGLATCNNELFTRLWHEVDISKVGFNFQDGDSARESESKWFPYNKGGGFRQWYGNNEYLVNWQHGGRAIHEYSHLPMDYAGAPVRAKQFYFQEGITYGLISSFGFSARRVFGGFVFDVGGSMIFPSIAIDKLQGFLSSTLVKALIGVLNPTLNYQVGDVQRLPIDVEAISRIDWDWSRPIAISKQDWDSFETSWDFELSELFRVRESSLKSTYERLAELLAQRVCEMKALQQENNDLYIAAYDVGDFITGNISDSDVTLNCNPAYRYGSDKSVSELETLLRADTMREFISYSVGCMFGRYSLDKPGLVLANQGNTADDYRQQIPEPTFAPDEDNVIPLLDGDWFEDDITERFKEFLKVTFGTEHYEANLKFLEDALYPDNLTAKKRKTIRDYFLKDFYSHHIKLYKKRPIYWLFSSPKGTFNALIYMHRYRSDTVGTVLHYIRDFRDKLTHHADHQQMLADSASASKSEKTQAIKDVAAIKKQLKELEEYEKTLFEVAARKIDIDLDDGVKHNYLLFGSVLRKIPGLDAKED
jgi:hypothetical protein